ncbi:hypothetical protein BTA51_09285 [Hahella sp. CCB-MM4]|nr:hypothetical protein BTA51_09285 [Hahella sp. CCB-MM4]
MGTWIKAKLLLPASIAERGLIELEIKETVFGRLQIMYMGSYISYFVNSIFTLYILTLYKTTISDNN